MPFFQLSTYYFFYFAFIGVVMPYFALYMQGRGFGAGHIGIALSVMPVTRLVAPNLGGWLADHTGKRMPVVRVSAALALIGFSLLQLVPGFGGVLLALAIMGFFWTAQNPLVDALILSHLAKAPARYGRIRAWGSLGFIVATFGMGWLLERASLNWVYYGGVAVLAITLACAFIVPDRAPNGGASGAKSSSLWSIVNRREVQVLLLVSMLMTAAHGTLNVFYTLHLVNAGYSKTFAGAMWAVGVFAEIGVFMVAPQIFARFSLRNIFFSCFICAIIRFQMIAWGVDSLMVLVLAQTMHGITFGAFFATTMALLHRWFGDIDQAKAQAVHGSVSFGVGGIVGNLMSGFLWEHTGAEWAFASSSALALLGLVVFLTGLKKETWDQARHE